MIRRTDPHEDGRRRGMAASVGDDGLEAVDPVELNGETGALLRFASLRQLPLLRRCGLAVLRGGPRLAHPLLRLPRLAGDVGGGAED